MNRRVAVLSFLLASTISASARRRHHYTEGKGKSSSPWPAPDQSKDAEAFDQGDKKDMVDRINNVWLPLLDASQKGTKQAVDALENPLARETLRTDLLKIINLLQRGG